MEEYTIMFADFLSQLVNAEEVEVIEEEGQI